jgi:hypothetical protein
LGDAQTSLRGRRIVQERVGVGYDIEQKAVLASVRKLVIPDRKAIVVEAQELR